MKAKELRKKTVEELNTEINELRKELFKLRMQRGSGQPPKSHLFRKAKREIARIKTILNEEGSNL